MIFQGDVIIKTMIELSIDDMRKNPWLIQDMLSGFVTNGYLKDKYGQKQIDSCQEWFNNNQIDIYMRDRDDKDRLPCVTIQMGNSTEKDDMKHMADLSTETKILLPNTIGKPIPYIIKPFVPTGYDPSTGYLSVGPEIDLSDVSPGMVLVSPASGLGFIIQGIFPETIVIETGMVIEATQLGVVPQYQYYEARVEPAFFNETYNIGCHAHGDPQNLLFLWSIVKYSILRYRESLLEANGFAESSVGSSGLDFDKAFTTAGGEKAYTRYITLTGQTENSWIKAPKRFIEVAALKKKVSNGYIGGISIISNTDPGVSDKPNQTWYPDTDAEVDDEDNS